MRKRRGIIKGMRWERRADIAYPTPEHYSENAYISNMYAGLGLESVKYRDPYHWCYTSHHKLKVWDKRIREIFAAAHPKILAEQMRSSRCWDLIEGGEKVVEALKDSVHLAHWVACEIGLKPSELGQDLIDQMGISLEEIFETEPQ